MYLIVNIGNSNIRFAIFKDVQAEFSWTINTKPYKTAGEFFMLFQHFIEQNLKQTNKINKIVVGSVVPHQTSVVCKVLQNILGVEPFVVTRNTLSKVSHSSNQMGTDLYANAVAAHYLYPKTNKIIVDFGTALTLTGINQEGQIQGVIIAPGVITSLNALVGNTAQLPDIELKQPKYLLGKDTETCMQSGIIYGYSSMVEGLIARIKADWQQEALVISTGGLGHIFKPYISAIDVDDKLHTIKGLKILYDENQNPPLK